MWSVEVNSGAHDFSVCFCLPFFSLLRQHTSHASTWYLVQFGCWVFRQIDVPTAGTSRALPCAPFHPTLRITIKPPRGWQPRHGNCYRRVSSGWPTTTRRNVTVSADAGSVAPQRSFFVLARWSSKPFSANLAHVGLPVWLSSEFFLSGQRLDNGPLLTSQIVFQRQREMPTSRKCPGPHLMIYRSARQQVLAFDLSNNKSHQSQDTTLDIYRIKYIPQLPASNISVTDS